MAAVASVMFNLGLVLQKEGAIKLPKIRRPDYATVRGFLTARLWLIGTGISLLGYGFEFFAFALAPFVLVQPVFSAGVVTLAFFAVVVAKERLHALEWTGIIITITGAVLVGISANPIIDKVSRERLYVGRLGLALVLAMLLAIVVNRIATQMGHSGEVLFGLSAGLAFTGAEMLTKLLGLELTYRTGLHVGPHGPGPVLITILLLIVFGLVGTYLLQVGFQHGRALIVGGVMGISADVLPILSGLVVFGERMPVAPFYFWMRVVGIVAAIGGALIVTFSPSTGHFIEQLEHGDIGPYAHHDEAAVADSGDVGSRASAAEAEPEPGSEPRVEPEGGESS